MLLSRRKYNFIRRAGKREAFSARLRGVQRLPGSAEAKEVAFMRELLEKSRPNGWFCG